jgi:sugar phosphate isomerase/epimerase
MGIHSNFDGDTDTAAERLSDLCERAATHGLAVGVEPIPVMGLTDLATAWRVIERAGCSNVGLVLDTWHFSRGAGTLEMVESLPGAAFQTVQISDGHLAGPPGMDYQQDTMSNRLPPGEGEFDIVGIIHALARIGADVGWDMEILSSDFDELPAAEAASRAAQATRAVLAEAGWTSIVRHHPA